jgi:uncharacterized protein YdcH (DUF465 family)
VSRLLPGGYAYLVAEIRKEERSAMSHTPHELHEEFPDKVEKISELKTSDAHFARLAEEYHALNRQVHRAETNVEPVAELAEVEMRKKRAALKDEIYLLLSA